MCKYSESQKASIYSWRERNPEKYLKLALKTRMKRYYWAKISKEFNNILLD